LLIYYNVLRVSILKKKITVSGLDPEIKSGSLRIRIHNTTWTALHGMVHDLDIEQSGNLCPFPLNPDARPVRYLHEELLNTPEDSWVWAG
jgi:hypothetical protein